LLTLHNLTFYLGLMRQMREAIARGDFSRFRARFLDRYGLESLRGSADDTPADSEA
jgi:tRNA-guanine family transglycosylase